MGLPEKSLTLREEEDSDESSAMPVDKSPDSALIGGLVAGFASAALLALIFYVLWRTRKRSYLAPQPERIVPVREASQVSSRSENPVINLGDEPAEEKEDDDPRASRASFRSRSRIQDGSLGRASPA